VIPVPGAGSSPGCILERAIYASTSIPSSMVLQVSSAPSTGSSSGPNDNLLTIAMEYRQSLGSPSISRSPSPSKSSTPRPAAAPRAAANPSPSSGGSDPSDNLLAAAMVHPFHSRQGVVL